MDRVSILAMAGPVYYWPSSGVAATGVMVFDDADVQSLIDSGSLPRVIMHEMGMFLKD